MQSYKTKKVIFWLEVNYPLMIPSYFWRRFLRISVLFTTLYVYHSLNKGCECSSKCIYLIQWSSGCQGDHHSMLIENVTSWFPRALSAQQLLTCRVASQKCCMNMWNLEMLITGNDLQRVWFHYLKLSAFKFPGTVEA